MKFEIVRLVDGDWTTDGVGENNEFDSYEEAIDALNSLKVTCPDWFTPESRFGVRVADV